LPKNHHGSTYTRGNRRPKRFKKIKIVFQALKKRRNNRKSEGSTDLKLKNCRLAEQKPWKHQNFFRSTDAGQGEFFKARFFV
jgi:hypothetical protein